MLAAFILLVAALYDLVTSDEREVHGLAKVEWGLVIVLLPIVGAVLWFMRGRSVAEQAALAASKEAHPSGHDRPRQLAPDDDPEFLRRVASDLARRNQNRSDEERLRRWEDELRRDDRQRDDRDDT